MSFSLYFAPLAEVDRWPLTVDVNILEPSQTRAGDLRRDNLQRKQWSCASFTVALIAPQPVSISAVKRAARILIFLPISIVFL